MHPPGLQIPAREYKSVEVKNTFAISVLGYKISTENRIIIVKKRIASSSSTDVDITCANWGTKYLTDPDNYVQNGFIPTMDLRSTLVGVTPSISAQDGESTTVTWEGNIMNEKAYNNNYLVCWCAQDCSDDDTKKVSQENWPSYNELVGVIQTTPFENFKYQGIPLVTYPELLSVKFINDYTQLRIAFNLPVLHSNIMSIMDFTDPEIAFPPAQFDCGLVFPGQTSPEWPMTYPDRRVDTTPMSGPLVLPDEFDVGAEVPDMLGLFGDKPTCSFANNNQEIIVTFGTNAKAEPRDLLVMIGETEKNDFINCERWSDLCSSPQGGQWGGFYDASKKHIGNTNPYTFMSLNYVQMEMTSDDPPVAVSVVMEGPEQVGNCQAVSRSLVIDGLAGRQPEIEWLKKNLANKIFGYLARCEFWLKLRW